VIKLLLALNLLNLSACQHIQRAPQATGQEVLYVSRVVNPEGGFTKGIEGPAADLNGNLYVVNYAKSGTIGILRQEHAPELWLELPTGGNSASIRMGRSGEMYVADYKLHRIYLINPATRRLDVFAEDLGMNQPNDMAISADGSLYLSDPTWDKAKHGHIWKFTGADHKFVHLKSNLRTPNGIDLSPDESKLYYTDSMEGMLYSYDINGEQLLNRQTLAKFPAETVDGLRTDSHGNLYLARIGLGLVEIYSPQGDLLHSITLLGKEPSNLAFGGPDGKTVYVTVVDRGWIEAFRVEYPGREWTIQRGPASK
jgi:gluconolactonase